MGVLVYSDALRASCPPSQENYVFARQMLAKVLVLPPAYQTLVARLFNGFSEREIAEKSGHNLRQVKTMRLELRRQIGDVGVVDYDKFGPTGLSPEVEPIPAPRCAPAAIRSGCVVAHNIFCFLRDERRWVSEDELQAEFRATGRYDMQFLQIPLAALEQIESIRIVQEREGLRSFHALKRPASNQLYAQIRTEILAASTK